MRLAEAEACDWEHELNEESSGASDLLPSLRARGCSREDNLETTFEDAISKASGYSCWVSAVLSRKRRVLTKGFDEMCHYKNDAAGFPTKIIGLITFFPTNLYPNLKNYPKLELVTTHHHNLCVPF